MLYVVLIYSSGYRTPLTTTPFLQSFFGGIWVHIDYNSPPVPERNPLWTVVCNWHRYFYQPVALVTLPVHRTVLIIVLCILQMIIVAQMLYVRGKG